MKPITVLSLFDGMGCGYEALKRAGIPVKTYYASEIDKHAITIAKKNHPGIIHLGDVTKWQDWLVEQPDLIIGGSPCQGFSFAGKQLAFDDPRSKLFFTMVDIIEHFKPRWKLLENVRMKKEHLDVITEYMGVKPHFINSALVSAQNRQRYYWYNWDAPDPEDKGMLLRDIIEHGVVDRDKSFCVDSNYWKGGNLKSYFEKHRRQLVFQINPCKKAAGTQPYMQDRVYHEDGKSIAVTASFGNRLNVAIHTSERGRRLTPDGGKRDDKNGKTCGLTTVQKDNYTTEDFIIRKLTPIECERLQTLPDNYTEGVSNTQRYRMIGNGWTVDAVAHLFRHLKASL